MKLVAIYSILFIGLSALFFFSCSTYPQSVAESKVSGRSLPPAEYYTDEDSDGIFELIQLEKNPEPIQGTEQWTQDFYGAITYPALARENGIQGIVVLEALINEAGKIEDVRIKKNLFKACDEESSRAFISASQQGYTPLIRNGVAVKFKMTYAVGFWLD